MPHRRSARPRSRVAAGIALVVAALAAVSGLSTPAHAAGTVYYVSPTGADTNSGTSANAPFKTIQKALDLAQPGTTINLAAGTYREALTTKVAGTAAAPITIKGPETGTAASGRYKATLYSLGGRVVSINHSYYTLDGFTIDGQPNIARTAYPSVSSLSQIRTFKDSVQAKAVNSKLIYVGADTTTFDIVGTTISNMFLNGSGGECIRFRERAANSLVVDSVIQWCGMLGQGDDSSQYKYHNAEGVYVGTSPKSTDQPLAANDTSNNIVVRNSTIDTFGSECFEVKENAHHNRLENSTCRWNDEPSSFQGSNVELRGDHNTVLGSTLSNSRSWNLKLASDSATYDRGGNTAQGSRFTGAATYAIINRQTAAGPFCGDTFTGPVSDPSGNSVGTPTAPCADTTAPTVTAQSPAANATGVAVGSSVTATFSEPVQGVTTTTFTLRPTTGATANVAATVSYDAGTRVATLKPSAALAANTQYTATLTGGASAIRDAGGTPLATVSWTFTTAAGQADTTPPTVTARTPSNNATSVSRTANITVTFSEAVTGVSTATFSLKNATTGATVAAVVTRNGTTNQWILNPNTTLASRTRFTVTLTGGAGAIRDAADNPLANISWTFTTGR
jgi:methionine-rich copper-binding protein CopC